MAHYLEVADELRKEVESFVEDITNQSDDGDGNIGMSPESAFAKRLGHIINLAIRCCPRGVQHTVRKNIVEKAVGKYCRVHMTEETDERTGNTFHKIHIEPRS